MPSRSEASTLPFPRKTYSNRRGEAREYQALHTRTRCLFVTLKKRAEMSSHQRKGVELTSDLLNSRNCSRYKIPHPFETINCGLNMSVDHVASRNIDIHISGGR